MSEYDYEYEEDPSAAAWNAGYEADPVATQWHLAQAAQAQFEAERQREMNESRVATEAAAQLVDYARRDNELRMLQATAQKAIGSLHAQHGERFEKVRQQVADRFAQSPPTSAEVNPYDAQSTADYLEERMFEIESNSPDNKYWQKVVDAGQKPYWQGMAAHRAEHGS